MFKSIFTEAAVIHFLWYFLSGVLMTTLFSRLYVWVTPGDERVGIRMGRIAPAITLTGATVGFALPLLAASLLSARIEEFLIWGLLAGLVQMVTFWVYYWLNRTEWRDMFRENGVANVASALHYAGMCVVVGAFNAASLVP